MPESYDVARPRIAKRVPSGPRPLTSRQSATALTLISSTIDNEVLHRSGTQASGSERWIQDGNAGLTHSPPPGTPDTAVLINPFDVDRDRTSSAGLAQAQATAVSPIRQVVKQRSVPLLSPKPKPKPLKVNTNLGPPAGSSPKKAVSPSLQHWQQIRSHVLTTPLDERVPPLAKVKGGIVGKAAAKLGFRQGSEDAYGTFAVRKATVDTNLPRTGALSEAEKEEIARERRRFARDVKSCLDACAREESRRRLAGMGKGKGRERRSDPSVQGIDAFKADFSAFAPLLTELHKYLPAARARKAWCRTCPHHTTILAELSTAFLHGNTSTSGERQQALEVFGVVVRSWAADGPEEELGRWLWLCHALKGGDRQLRNRGLVLLSSFLHHDPSLPTLGERPGSSAAFEAVAVELLELLRAVERSEYDAVEHRQIVLGLLQDLVEGNIVNVQDGIGGQVGKSGGGEKELLWLATGSTLVSSEMVEWLFSPDNPILLSFAPPPLLHATPSFILHLRLRASITFLRSLTAAIPSLQSSVAESVFRAIQDLIITPLTQLSGDMKEMTTALGGFLVACLVYGGETMNTQADGNDPFSNPAVADRVYLIAVEITLKLGGDWASGLEQALHGAMADVDLERVLLVLEAFLGEKELRSLASVGVSALFRRIEKSITDGSTSCAFLQRLAKSHPQLFYKPLFSLSASSLPGPTIDHLRTVRALCQSTGSYAFWLDADPHMVAVVLMGDGGPIKSKGKGKEGVADMVNVRIGRYAVLVELLNAFGEVMVGVKVESRLKGFLDKLEVRLGAILQVQEANAVLPDAYRALICLVFYRIRTITQSAKKAEWQHFILRWILDMQTARDTTTGREDPLNELREIYRTLLCPPPQAFQRAPTRKSTAATDITLLTPPSVSPSDPIHPLLHLKLLTTSAELLVLLQSCWTDDEWAILLPIVWRLLKSDSTALKSLIFLFQKCCETIPNQVRTLLDADLQHPHAVVRSSAFHKIALMYVYRHQIASLPSIRSKRGPLFHFGNDTLDFVITEIGSPVWSAPHDVKQEALQKYGANLPMDVRQQLMELGWSDNPGLKADDGNQAEPISSLPIRHLLESGDVAESGRAGLRRHHSGGSGSEAGSGKKADRAVFAPVLWEAVGNQAVQGQMQDGGAACLSLELVRQLQRDEPNLFIRAFAEHFTVDFRGTLSRLNAATASPTPGFAYIAFNAIVGFLKQSLRQSPVLDDYAYALTTLATLAVSVPGVSLREIRKRKAEHVLLPASIHEEDGGFKIHAPWRDERVDVQSAQLLLVTEILQVNPREVRVIKRMMSNLQIPRSSFGDQTFARAWLNLIITLFGLVSRSYNDRAELRHFLTTATAILRTHHSDLLIVTQAVRFFMLCSARFRRLFAIMGFQTVIRPMFDTYSSGDRATRDCMEYAMRSFYRIHQDSFVYQGCLAISASEAETDPAAVYSILSCLSEPNDSKSGIASGIRGTNDKEEHEALIQMLSGPEIALSELGKDRAERQAEKLAQAALSETHLFPRESIVRLFVTVIAANPPSVTAIQMSRLFAGMVPCMKDQASRGLLGDGIEALGGIISREKVDLASAGLMPGDGIIKGDSDWVGAKVGYLRLIELWMGTGGQVSSSTSKVVLEMMGGLLSASHSAIYPIHSSILHIFTSTQLGSDKPATSLKAIADTFMVALGILDVSGVLEELGGWIRRYNHNVSPDIARVTVDPFLRPAVRYLIDAQSLGLPVDMKLRESTVSLLAATVLLPSGAMDILEEEDLSLGLLAHIICPLVESFDKPTGVELEQRTETLWIRLLHLVIKFKPARQTTDSRSLALIQALSLQVMKVICVRAPEIISSVSGLWSSIAHHIISIISPRFPPAPAADRGGAVGLVDLMAWSMFELLSLHRSPLMLHIRYHIQVALAESDDAQSAADPFTPSNVTHQSSYPPHHSDFNPIPNTGRSPSMNLRRPSVSHARHLSSSPNRALGSPSSGRISRLSASPEPSDRLSSLRPPASPNGSFEIRELPLRPTFTELSLRRASRTVSGHPVGKPFGVGGTRFRFPSSAVTRKTGGGGAIVHLIGAAGGLANAAGGGTAVNNSQGDRLGDEEPRHGAMLTSPELVARVQRSKKACRVIFGYPMEVEEDEEPLRAWSVFDALLEISEETRLLVEVEFSDLFHRQQQAADEKREEGVGRYGSANIEALRRDVAAEEKEKDEGEEPLLTY